jgi:hypothetical protein
MLISLGKRKERLLTGLIPWRFNMTTEYLNKCRRLLNWEEAFDSEALWAEMGNESSGFVELSVLFSNELVLNLLETVTKEQAIKVVEVYLQGCATGREIPLEFGIGNIYNFEFDLIAKGDPMEKGWRMSSATSQEKYWARCYELTTYLMNEIELVSVINDIHVPAVIDDLSLRLSSRGLKDVAFLTGYLSPLLRYDEVAITQNFEGNKIPWIKSEVSFRQLYEALLSGGFISNKDFFEVASHFKGVGHDSLAVSGLIDWRYSQRLLILLIQHLMKANFITHETQLFKILSTHFTKGGKGFNPKSIITEKHATQDGDIVVRGSASLYKILSSIDLT